MEKGEGVYNVVVIGGGTAGLVTAAGTAGLGGRVALIERNRMGGDCLNTGCVPSKALISSARLIEQIRQSGKWGLLPQTPAFRFEMVFERMRERRAAVAPHDSQERFESLGVDVFQGQARFVSEREVRVGDVIAEGEELRHRDRDAGRDPPHGRHRPRALLHQRDGLRRAAREAREPDRARRRADRLRARPGVRAAGSAGHDPPAPPQDPGARGPGRVGIARQSPRGGGGQRPDGRAGAGRRAARGHDPRLGGHRGSRNPAPDRLRCDPRRGRARAEHREPGSRGGRRRLHGEGRDGQRAPPDFAVPHLRRGRRGGTAPLHPRRRLPRAHGRAQHPAAMVEVEARGRGHPVVHLHVAGSRARGVERAGGGSRRGSRATSGSSRSRNWIARSSRAKRRDSRRS